MIATITYAELYDLYNGPEDSLILEFADGVYEEISYVDSDFNITTKDVVRRISDNTFWHISNVRTHIEYFELQVPLGKSVSIIRMEPHLVEKTEYRIAGGGPWSFLNTDDQDN